MPRAVKHAARPKHLNHRRARHIQQTHGERGSPKMHVDAALAEARPFCGGTVALPGCDGQQLRGFVGGIGHAEGDRSERSRALCELCRDGGCQ